MKNKSMILSFFLLMIMMIAAGCGPEPGEQDPLQTYSAQTLQAQHIIETIVAQTLAAFELEKTVQQPTAAIQLPSPTATVTSTAEPAADNTPTPTAATLVMAEVSVPTNCRSGPGKIFDRVSVLNVQVKAEVIGRNASGTYWIIKNPGGSGYCWLWDRYAILTGNTNTVPIWDEPPKPTPVTHITPSPTGATLKVRVPTNCRVGPGKAYEILSVLHTGKTANVVARHESQDFWVIENPEGSGYCWVWGYYAAITGSKTDIPIWEAPPTPTPDEVTLKVSVDTYCRTGPGKAYEIITILKADHTADVVARNFQETYWVIKNPSGTGTCWVWGNYARVSGSAGSLPIWSPPSTPTPTKTP